MGKKVLLVEYEPRYIQRLTSVFQSKGWTVEIAKDGEEAIEKISSFLPDYIFISAVLPKIRTADVIQSIKSNPDLKEAKIVLLATGIKDDLIELEKKKKGVDQILCKPFSETKIIECLEALAPKIEVSEEKLEKIEVSKEEKKESILDLIPKEEKKLTSKDLFGEILTEKPAPPKEEKKKEETEDLLHKTLSSIAKEKPKKAEAAPGLGDEIEKKLTETLAGIRVPAKPKKITPEEKIVEKEEKAYEETIKFEREELVPKKEEIEEKGERFGNYILIEKLGTGGMAEIYKAKMEGVEGFQKLVAIKRILPQFTHNKEFTTMFIDEAKVAAQLSHRNIVHIYDLGKIENSYFIAMEYVEGTDLKKVIHEAKERGEKIPIPVSLFIVSQVASALDYAHNKKDSDGRELNIVHRDVSPQNILISNDGEIKICDFGIAKAASKASHTRAGSLKGKLQYMSPEQAWGKTVDYKSDIFSLGIVLYEMLTGKNPFEGDSELSILEKVRNPKIDPLSKYLKDYPKELEEIINNALKEDPKERYIDAGAMKKDIEDILSRYEPKISEKTISEYLTYLFSKTKKPLEFKYIEPKKVEEIKEEVKKVEKEEKILEEEAKVPPKEIEEKKAPEIKLPERKPVLLIEEEKPKEKKFPVWVIGAGIAVVLVLLGLFLISGGKKEEVIKKEVPEKTEEVLKTEEEKGKEIQKVEEKKILEEQPKKIEEKKPQELQEKKETKLESKEVPETKKPEEKPKVEEVKKEQVKPQIEETIAPPAEPQVETRQAEIVTEKPKEEEKPKEPEKKEEPVVEQKPKFKTGDFVPPGTPGLHAPRPITKEKPNYPPIAKMQRLSGKVDVKVLVDENGNVIEATAISGNPIFKTEAESAARKTKFVPAELDGVKVKTYFTLTFNFNP